MRAGERCARGYLATALVVGVALGAALTLLLVPLLCPAALLLVLAARASGTKKNAAGATAASVGGCNRPELHDKCL